MTGQTLALVRHEQGFSQQDFADVLGISRRTVASLERSDHIPPKYLARLRSLGIHASDKPPTHPPNATYRPQIAPPRAYIPDDTDTDEVAPYDDEDVDDEFEENSTINDVLSDELHAPDDYKPFHADHLPTPHRTKTVPNHHAPPPPVFELQTVPGNIFRIMRQKMEITVARLVKLSGLVLSDIETAESSTALVPQTLFESLLTAAELPTLAEPDTFLAYLADAVAKRLDAGDPKPVAIMPTVPSLAHTHGSTKDAAAIEATHYKWAYEKTVQELAEMKSDYRETSKIAAERLEKIHALQREVDRLTVQNELSTEFSEEYLRESSTLQDDYAALTAASVNRWNEAKTSALEAVPRMLPAVMGLAQMFMQSKTSKPPSSPFSSNEQHSKHKTDNDVVKFEQD